jgi:hydroxyacyl-ACP dehydratase HTD2-like protein with hotdog domain
VTAEEPGLAAAVAGWAPDPSEATDLITAGPAIALAGLLDAPPPVTGPGDPLPPLWHWLYFLARPAERELGPDGHPAAGPFMPPIPRRRRMFAGGRVTWHAPVRCGDELTRRSELAGWTVRQGRSGELLFVTVRDTISRAGRPVITEEQDLVYRSSPAEPEAAPPPAPPSAPAPVPAAAPVDVPADPWRLELSADPVLLFRFSALTYNAHRIHYDADYATRVEGHPGLVVHGPLLAVLMLELPRRHLTGAPVAGLTFRARSPLYAGDAFTVSGGPSGSECDLRVTAPAGHAAMTAQVRLAPDEH